MTVPPLSGTKRRRPSPECRYRRSVPLVTPFTWNLVNQIEVKEICLIPDLSSS